MAIFLRTPFNYDADVVSHASGLDCSNDPSRAQQHMRDECDINIMVERFSRTGQLPPAPPAPGQVDFEEVFDFQSAMNVIIEAQRSFDALPAKVRKEFDNDPSNMMVFLQDGRNRDRAIELGLIDRPVEISPSVETPIDDKTA